MILMEENNTMKAFFQTFFSTEIIEDPSFPFFQLPHLIPLLLAVIAIFIFIKNKDYIRENGRKVKLILGSVILVSAILKQTWYIMSDLDYITEGLPLYLCRLTFLITILSFMFNFKKLNFVIIYQGSFGGLVALLSPDVSGYLFPHFFYINYFLSHTLLILAALTVFIADDFIADRKQLTNMLIYNFGFVMIIDIINQLLGSNYGYTMFPPESLTMLSNMDTGILYKLILFLIMSLFGLFSHLFFKLNFVKGMQTTCNEM